MDQALRETVRKIHLIGHGLGGLSILAILFQRDHSPFKEILVG
jgi:hypothetical protein